MKVLRFTGTRVHQTALTPALQAAVATLESFRKESPDSLDKIVKAIGDLQQRPSQPTSSRPIQSRRKKRSTVATSGSGSSSSEVSSESDDGAYKVLHPFSGPSCRLVNKG